MVVVKKGAVYCNEDVKGYNHVGLAVMECISIIHDTDINKYVCVFYEYVGGNLRGIILEYLDSLDLAGYKLYQDVSPFSPEIEVGQVFYSNLHKTNFEVMQLFTKQNVKGESEVLVKNLGGSSYPYQVYTEQYIRNNMVLSANI